MERGGGGPKFPTPAKIPLLRKNNKHLQDYTCISFYLNSYVRFKTSINNPQSIFVKPLNLNLECFLILACLPPPTKNSTRALQYHTYMYISGFYTGCLLGGDFCHVGDLGVCPIEIMPLEIVELEMTNFDSTSAVSLKPCIWH